MANAIQDGVGQGRIADGLKPMLHGQLACDDCGSAAVAVFEAFQQVTALRDGEDGKAPIVDDQHIHAGDGLEDALKAAIAKQRQEKAQPWVIRRFSHGM